MKNNFQERYGSQGEHGSESQISSGMKHRPADGLSGIAPRPLNISGQPRQTSAPDALSAVPSQGGRQPTSLAGVRSKAGEFLTQGDFSDAHAIGQTARASAKQAAGLAVAPIREGVKGARQLLHPVEEFSKGFAGIPSGSSGQRDSLANVPASALDGRQIADDALASVRGTPETSQGPAIPERAVTPEDRAPVNDDPLAGDFLSAHSAERSPGRLDVNNMRPVDGLSNVNYAGRYGGTEVFGNVEENPDGTRHGRFSDRENLATLTGGQAAAVPEGRRAVTNADAGLNSRLMQTENQLREGRLAAVDRGDFEAYDRSMMSSQERTATDEARRNEQLRQQAYAQDPLSAYSVDTRAQGQAAQAAAQADQTRYDRDRHSRLDKLQEDRGLRETEVARSRVAADARKIRTEAVDRMGKMLSDDPLQQGAAIGLLNSILNNAAIAQDPGAIESLMPVIQAAVEDASTQVSQARGAPTSALERRKLIMEIAQEMMKETVQQAVQTSRPIDEDADRDLAGYGALSL